MKELSRAFCLLIFMLLALSAGAQEISVASFTKIENDMDARINYPELDPSGRKCAIIKVVTTITGFTFDTGTMGIIKTSQKAGEIWVYVQPGVKKITIGHQNYGVLRNHYLPIPVEEAACYELRLRTSGAASADGQAQQVQSGYLVITSEPEGADVAINGEWVGRTPYQKKYPMHERVQYRVSMALYHPEVGEVEIANTKNEVKAQLLPAFGSIEVASNPSGAEVVLDDEGAPRGTTPLTIDRVASGAHRVRVQMPRYGQQVLNVSVADGQKATANATLSASFAKVTVNTLPGATVKVDGVDKGAGTISWEQDAGLCDIEVSLVGHRPASRQIDVEPGQPQTVTLNPTPMYGTISVESDPIGAEIWIDGERRGTTPDIIDKVLAMPHELRLSKAGCADYTASVDVKESQEAAVNATLSTGQLVTIKSDRDDDQIYIDGSYAGASPLQLTLPYGTHSAYSVRGDKRSTEKSFTLSPSAPVPDVALSFGREFTVKGVTFTMIPIEGGTFEMGATGELAKEAYDWEEPVHKVTLSDYMLGETEVTQALWKAVMGSNPSHWQGDNLPVENVGWVYCQEFINKLNQLTGQNFRLPTEAEWEYAAKGGNKAQGYRFAGSNDINSVAWYVGNSGSKTHPVRGKHPNELGLYDMTGNVWEWCQDWYGSYTKSAQTNPTGPSSGSNRVERGGGWDYSERYCRVSNRNCRNPDYRISNLGLRLAL